MSKQPSGAQGPADVLMVMSYVVLAMGIGSMAFLIANGNFIVGVLSLLGGVFFFALGLTIATMAQNQQQARRPASNTRPKLKL